jgi:hypothetical protein
MNKKLLLLLFVVSFIAVLACNKKDEETSTNISDTTTKQNVEQQKQTENNVEQQDIKEQPDVQPKRSKTDASKTKAGLDVVEDKKLQSTLQEHCKNPEKQMRAINVSFTDGALFSGKYEISYTITNRSDLVSIRNVSFRIDYLDDEDNIIGTDKHFFHNTFKPKMRLDTMLKSPRIKGTDKIRIVCIDAECVK